VVPPSRWPSSRTVKRWYLCTNLHGVISHTTEHFIIAVVGTSELAFFICVGKSEHVEEGSLQYQEGLL